MGAYESLMVKQKDIETIGQISGLLGWDQEVMMPPSGAPIRAEQLAWVSKTAHERITDSKIGSILEELECNGDLDDVQLANLRLTRQAYDRATKLPIDFVEEIEG